ncbi:MAG: TIGR01777 family protein [Variovorax sp.]|nr:MAG: TIGR01777 family protein [Variovorax sp.]
MRGGAARQNRTMSTPPHSPPDAMGASALRFGDAPQHVLVTGGTGFVGRHLVAALLGDGHTVTVWTRNVAAAARGFDATVRCVRQLDEIPASTTVDVVVNLAGARIVGPRWTAARQADLLKSRAGLTDDLVAWIARRPVKPWLLLSGSAVGYYGVQPQGDASELTESSPPQSIFMSRLCQAWEASAAAAAAQGVRVACMRFGLVLGHGGALPGLLMPVNMGVGGRLGTGRQWVSWIHLQDLLGAMGHVWRLAAARGAPTAPQAWNFTAPETLVQEDFMRTAAQVLHRPFWLPVPGAPVRLALGEQADVLLEGQRVAPKRLTDTGFRFRFPDARSALQDLC